MSWTVGAVQYVAEVPLPGADVVVRLKAGGKLTKMTVTRRKTDKSDTVLVTVNKSTVIRLE